MATTGSCAVGGRQQGGADQARDPVGPASLRPSTSPPRARWRWWPTSAFGQRRRQHHQRHRPQARPAARGQQLHRRLDARGHEDVARRQVRRRHRHERHQQAAGLAVLQRQRHPAGVGPQRHAAHQVGRAADRQVVPGRRLGRQRQDPAGAVHGRGGDHVVRFSASPASRCRRAGSIKTKGGPAGIRTAEP